MLVNSGIDTVTTPSILLIAYGSVDEIVWFIVVDPVTTVTFDAPVIIGVDSPASSDIAVLSAVFVTPLTVP